MRDREHSSYEWHRGDKAHMCTCTVREGSHSMTTAGSDSALDSHQGFAGQASLSPSPSAAQGCACAPHLSAHIRLPPSPQLPALATAGFLDHGTTDI